MKIGIVTINGNENYGNVLQNYAVQEVLKEVNGDSETILNITQKGHCEEIEKKVNKLTVCYIKKYIISQLNYRYNIKNTNQGLFKAVRFYIKNKRNIEDVKRKRVQNFIDFKNSYISCSRDILDINKEWDVQQIRKYDYFVSGSDQVWNPVYPSTSSINFLQFAPKEKRIALSPSFGVNEIPEYLQSEYKQWLEEIPYLSVREEQGAKIIKKLCGRNAKVLCDPTMALTQEQWRTLEKRPESFNDEKYILTYFLGNKNREYDTYINKIAEREKYKVINLFDITDIQAYATSPQEFLYLIDHASLVCTDSFHGAVFSIIMNSDFITFSRNEIGNSMESRINTLLSTFGFEDREYKKVKKDKIFNLDFSHTYGILTLKRQEMFEFLKSAMSQGEISKDAIDEKAKDISIFAGKDHCCGCSACAMICPKQCITMERDEEGFLYPKINNSLCIHCNKCQKVCPVKNDVVEQNNCVKCYAAYSKNQDTRVKSSSGGIFSELAQYVLDDKGIIYGAGFTENFQVEHQSVTRKQDLKKLMGSKYVQSSMGDIYKQVEKNLKQGIKVYFSGTPCQVKGLKDYLQKEYDNLITQDIICHGVPSPWVWEKYINQYSGIEDVSFRNKKFGWHYFSMYIKYHKGLHRKRLNEDFYIRLFLDNTILRPICYECPIKEKGSNADITLADCWGAENLCKKLKDTDQGLSLVILHTERGKQIWNDIAKESKITFEELDTNEALESQRALKKSAPCNPRRAIFFKQLQSLEFQRLEKFWYEDSVFQLMRKKEVYVKTKILHYIKRYLNNK